MAHPRVFDDTDPLLGRLRGIALAMPEAEERIAHGRPWFFVGRAFAVYGGGTKGPNRVDHPHALLVHIDLDERPARLQDPRFFVPAYVGPQGWLGIDLDDVDWTEIAELVEASWQHAAPAASSAPDPVHGSGGISRHPVPEARSGGVSPGISGSASDLRIREGRGRGTERRVRVRGAGGGRPCRPPSPSRTS